MPGNDTAYWWKKGLKAVTEFCFLRGLLSAEGGWGLAAVTRCKSAWHNFRQLLPHHTNNLSLLTRGRLYSICVKSVLVLHAVETWTITVVTQSRLRRNERAMICWICNVQANDEISSDSLLSKLGILDLDVVLRTSRIR